MLTVKNCSFNYCLEFLLKEIAAGQTELLYCELQDWDYELNVIYHMQFKLFFTCHKSRIYMQQERIRKLHFSHFVICYILCLSGI